MYVCLCVYVHIIQIGYLGFRDPCRGIIEDIQGSELQLQGLELRFQELRRPSNRVEGLMFRVRGFECLGLRA